MIRKVVKGRKCYVTFELNREGAKKVYLVGEWNNWEPEPMVRRGNRFVKRKEFPCGREYRFRYLIDGSLWENDPQADGYVPNPFGSEDCVVRT